MKEAVVANPMKASRQYMLNDAPEELYAGQSFDTGISGFTVSVLKSHLTTVIAENFVTADHTAVEIAGQVLEGRFATAGVIAVHYPMIGCGGRTQAGLLDVVQHLAPEYRGQGKFVEEEAMFCALPDALPFVDTATRNDHVQMRVVGQPAAVGM